MGSGVRQESAEGAKELLLATLEVRVGSRVS